MAYKVKGPHTVTLGYPLDENGKPTRSPILKHRGEYLPDTLSQEDLKSLAKHNNLTDDQGRDYGIVDVTEVQTEYDENGDPHQFEAVVDTKMVRVLRRNKDGVPVQFEELDLPQSGQPSAEEVAATAASVNPPANSNPDPYGGEQ